MRNHDDHDDLTNRPGGSCDMNKYPEEVRACVQTIVDCLKNTISVVSDLRKDIQVFRLAIMFNGVGRLYAITDLSKRNEWDLLGDYSPPREDSVLISEVMKRAGVEALACAVVRGISQSHPALINDEKGIMDLLPTDEDGSLMFPEHRADLFPPCPGDGVHPVDGGGSTLGYQDAMIAIVTPACPLN